MWLTDDFLTLFVKQWSFMAKENKIHLAFATQVIIDSDSKIKKNIEYHHNNPHIFWKKVSFLFLNWKIKPKTSPGGRLVYVGFVYNIRNKLLTNANHLCSFNSESVYYSTHLLMAWAGSEQLVLFFSPGSPSWLGPLYWALGTKLFPTPVVCTTWTSRSHSSSQTPTLWTCTPL